MLVSETSGVAGMTAHLNDIEVQNLWRKLTAHDAYSMDFLLFIQHIK